MKVTYCEWRGEAMLKVECQMNI